MLDVPSGVGVVPDLLLEVVVVAILLCVAVWCLGSPDQPSD